ncbi:MAG TPA: hypothetical protein VGU74_12295 [Gemmatimonadales bacterium]|nr:hypothetical protein [Gemmatimonadales bacterium]
MRRLFVAILAAALVGCSDSSSPAGVPGAQLHIIQQDTTAPPLVATRDSFWAKVGDGRELRFNYQGANPADTGEEFLRFEVPGDALLRKPDGSAFQTGDSILITITIEDPSKFLFRFEPAGLQFSLDQPARLKVEYFHADHDFNDDGVVNAADSSIEHILDVWRREGPTADWFRTGSVKFEELDEIDANILSFTEYAIAW